MVRSEGRYLGDLRIETIHGPSKSILITDAPLDNQGKGDAFSPTDLVATALATCILTTMAIVAERDGIDLSSSTFCVDKEMANSPRRIGNITINMDLPRSLNQEQRTKLERISMACPVHHSLHPDIKILVNFKYSI